MTATTRSASVDRREALVGDPMAQFARMVEIRDLEERVNVLFASGAIHGTTHLCIGQEALAVGLASVLRSTDVVTATYRGHGIALALGMSPESVLGEIMGKADGGTGGVGGSMHLCDTSVGLLPTFAIVGGGLPVAAGAALGFQTRGEDGVGVAVVGDGAANIGAFHETLNLASVWRLPAVFIIDNNSYAEYSRINLTTPMEDLYLRASAYGMPGVQVDGMDVDAVIAAVSDAVARARSGDGPTLIEAKTYRFAGHSRADAATYRPQQEVDEWRKRDPLIVTRASIIAKGLADEAALDALDEHTRADVAEIVARVDALPGPAIAAMFEHVWHDSPNVG